MSGVALFWNRNYGVVRMILPPDQIVILRRGDAHAGLDAEPAEHRYTVLVDVCVAAVDSFVRIPGLRHESRRMKRPVYQVAARSVSPAVLSSAVRLPLVDVHQVIPPLPVDTSVRIVRPADAFFRQRSYVIRRPLLRRPVPGGRHSRMYARHFQCRRQHHKNNSRHQHAFIEWSRFARHCHIYLPGHPRAQKTTITHGTKPAALLAFHSSRRTSFCSDIVDQINAERHFIVGARRIFHV